MSANIREEKLDFWIKNNLNVLFIGKHGVGKTSMVKDAYDRNDWQGVLEAQDAVNLMVQKSPSPVDFLKTYATEKGFPTPLHNRSQASNPYMSDRAPMTREEYDRFKPLFEETIARFS
ncbi:MAG TPA: hypothetical protein P5069_17565 [Candidatus Hydrogenedentes bacterium]|nr:hypothetical protein [Candidatus Hydrogenedentota bacterium]